MSQSSNNIRPRGERGFTLLEVLVAFIILALILGVTLQIFSTGLGNSETARRYANAVALARTQLALTVAQEPLREGDDAGDFAGGYRWHAAVVRVDSDAAEDAVRTVFPYEIRVTVSWPGDNGRERAVTLTTMRLAGVSP